MGTVWLVMGFLALWGLYKYGIKDMVKRAKEGKDIAEEAMTLFIFTAIAGAFVGVVFFRLL